MMRQKLSGNSSLLPGPETSYFCIVWALPHKIPGEVLDRTDMTLFYDLFYTDILLRFSPSPPPSIAFTKQFGLEKLLRGFVSVAL